ncbi:hypothetical protein F4779DRAFT_628781 [Xylariaceae sp. FL0662B]|nr:hypothetical protein F4779DRAFT_628781 [Xylariaceae sp. FL0662B]
MVSQAPSGSACATASASDSAYKPRYIDIGINLADPIFRGQYHGTQRHPDDLSAVISRAQEVGCQKLIVTGSDFASSRHALEIAKEYPGIVYTTAGIHPCSSSIFGTAPAPAPTHEDSTPAHTRPCSPYPSQPESANPAPDPAPDPARTASIIAELRTLITRARETHPRALVALGEMGLDYDRLHYCPRALQRHAFAAQLSLAASLDPPLPLFLHSRAAHGDFITALQSAFGARLERLAPVGAVVHSFTGTAAELRELMDLGLYVGVNGCSFKTVENCAVVREVRLDRLLLETDGPWCEVRPSHEGWRYLVAAAGGDTRAVADDGNAMDGVEAVVQQQAQKQNSKSKKQQQQQQQKKKNKGPEVPERFKVVKKEKWVEGAMVKGRNEPCTIERVAAIVAGIKGVSVAEVCEAAWRNTTAVFALGDD